MALEVIRSRELVPESTDLIVVLGKNLGEGWKAEKVQSSPDYLSIDSCINVLAAGELYRPGLHIMLSGGRTIGEGFPSQPQAAETYLRKKYLVKYPDRALLGEDIELEETGFDTRASAEALARMVDDPTNHYRHIGLLSVGYHVERSARLFKNWGVPIESIIASEDIVAERSIYHARYIERWRQRERVSQEIKNERRLRALLTIDRKSRIPRLRTALRVAKDFVLP